MTHLSIVRHQEIFNPVKNNPQITIIGAGATGSRLWLTLVELGLSNIRVFDFDVVEEHNLANQIFLKHHVGMSKVAALADYYTLKTGRKPPASMEFIHKKIQKGVPKTDVQGIVFLLTDTMASRHEIFTSCMKNAAYMIETRMASSYGNINVVNMYNDSQKKKWLSTLVSDDEAEVSSCGASISVAPTAALIANMAVWAFINLLTAEDILSTETSVFYKPFLLTAN